MFDQLQNIQRSTFVSQSYAESWSVWRADQASVSSQVQEKPDVCRTLAVPVALHRGSRRAHPNIAAVHLVVGEYLQKNNIHNVINHTQMIHILNLRIKHKKQDAHIPLPNEHKK